MKLKPPEAEDKAKGKEPQTPAPEPPEPKADAEETSKKEEITLERSMPANLLEQGKKLVITDQGTYELGMVIYNGVKAMLKTIDDGYKPIEAAQKGVLDLTKKMRSDARAPYEEAKKYLESQIWGWNKKVEELRKEETKAVEEYVDKALSGEQGELLPETVKAPTAALNLDKRTFKLVWKGKVVDENTFFKALALFPQFRKYVKINQAQLNSDAKDKKGKLKVPGVQFVEEEPFENSGD